MVNTKLIHTFPCKPWFWVVNPGPFYIQNNALQRMACAILIHQNYKKIKQSRNRPGVAQRVPGGLGSQISWHSAHEGSEVVSLTHRPPLPPGMFLVLIFTRGWVDPRAMVPSEGNMSLKNPVTPPGIDPGTVRLVAQRLNHYATPGHTKTILDFKQYRLINHYADMKY